MKSVDKYIGEILKNVEKLKKEIQSVILHFVVSLKIMEKQN